MAEAVARRSLVLAWRSLASGRGPGTAAGASLRRLAPVAGSAGVVRVHRGAALSSTPRLAGGVVVGRCGAWAMASQVVGVSAWWVGRGGGDGVVGRSRTPAGLMTPIKRVRLGAPRLGDAAVGEERRW